MAHWTSHPPQEKKFESRRGIRFLVCMELDPYKKAIVFFEKTAVPL
jgi:hypothetical protein